MVGKNKALLGAQQNFKQRKKLWILLTITAFLAHSFWIYAVVLIGALLSTVSKEKNIPALFYFLLFLIPAASIQVPGFGLVNYLIDLDHIRLLTLVLLLPAWLKLRSSPKTLRFGAALPDRLLATYLILIVILLLTRSVSFTDVMRRSAYLFVDVYLPYYVFSRALRNITDFRDVLSSYVIATAILGAIAAFETLRHWHPYTSVLGPLGIGWGYGGYLPREGMLRAIATTGQPIALGLVMVVSVGFFLYLINANAKGNRMMSAPLVAGVIAPLSRGPWLGLAAMLIVFVGSGRQAVAKLSKLFFTAALTFALLAMLPAGKRMLDFLPFVGNVETSGIDYRQQLIDNSLIVIQRNLMFGSGDFLQTPEMQAMLQGQGIIDVTNTYLAIALNSGLSGIILFVLVFLVAIFSLYRNIKKIQHDHEVALLGRALLSVVVAIMIILATVSSITIIPTIYWTVLGVAVAFISMVNDTKSPLKF